MFYRRPHENGDFAPAVSQRFEAKYQITDVQAREIREHIWPYMEPDAHGREYPVTSIYLDSPDLNMYHSSARGEERRQKLRIRTYTGSGNGVCYFEVKHRRNQIVSKERAVIHAEWAPALLRGEPIRPEMLASPDRDMRRLYTFTDIRESLQATPRVVVRYLREAYVGRMEEPLRITFDRNVSGLPSGNFDPDGWAESRGWLDAPNSPIVLEVKFTDVFPAWLEDMVRRLRLIRTSYAKYVICVDALRAEGISVAGHMREYV